MKRAALLAAGLLALALAPALLAEEPNSSAQAPAPPAPSGSTRPHERLERRLARLQQQALELASALPLSSAAPPLPSSSATPSLAQGQELLQRWAELAATRHARRQKHREELQQELGELASDPDIAAELRLHAQRLSDLARVEFLAKNARSGPQRAQLLARTGRLLQREAERHRVKLARLLSKAKAATGEAPR